MKRIERNIAKLEELPNTDIISRIDLITKINKYIDEEKEKLSATLETIDEDSKLHKKYEDKSIKELQEIFESSKSVKDKIKIYQTLKYKVDDVVNKLFDNDLDDSDDSEYLESE